ncbi:hypothetical protein [Phyllobacterium sp. P30BS-XVII]|uniref:hypothetical protein n=1 Tax=Phyllobacterium sp. P30BS-XVII TaxID=2587046 RepID=UPI0015F93CB0|nr:hypothetical protein [Phyllobacterium sp. P30BS-XVII]MBA8904114.1 hypothetical protein [Phyllobacterium sp. P30BS-XVII]
MGDRCDLRLAVHGHIETVEQLTRIIAALDEAGMTNETAEGDYRLEFADAIQKGTSPVFMFDECYTDEAEPVEAVLQELELPYHVEHGAGDYYPGGQWIWSKEKGYIGSIAAPGRGSVVEFLELEKALAQGNPLAAVRALFEHNVIASGFYLPDFSVSADVRKHLGLSVEVLPC